MTPTFIDTLEAAKRAEARTRLQQGWTLWALGVGATLFFVLITSLFSPLIALFPIWVIFEVVAWALSVRFGCICLKADVRSGWIRIGAAILIWFQFLPLTSCCGFAVFAGFGF